MTSTARLTGPPNGEREGWRPCAARCVAAPAGHSRRPTAAAPLETSPPTDRRRPRRPRGRWRAADGGPPCAGGVWFGTSGVWPVIGRVPPTRMVREAGGAATLPPAHVAAGGPARPLPPTPSRKRRGGGWWRGRRDGKRRPAARRPADPAPSLPPRPEPPAPACRCRHCRRRGRHHGHHRRRRRRRCRVRVVGSVG